MVDNTTNYPWMRFCYAYSGYNQIPMNKEDGIHIMFITKKGLFYYKVMPFGLKNVKTIYQGHWTSDCSFIREDNGNLYRWYGGKEYRGMWSYMRLGWMLLNTKEV